MLRTTVIILFAVVPTLSQILAKFAPAYAGSYNAKPVDRSQQDRRTRGSQPRLPPARAFAPAYAGSYSAKLADRSQQESRTLPDQYYDARAIAPGLKEKLAQKAVETAFTPRVPAYSETDTSGGASGFAPEYAPNYAPAFFGSVKGSTKSVSAPASAWTAPAYAPQEVAARPSTYSKPSSGGASGFAPSYAAAYAPAFGSAPDSQASSFTAPAYGAPKLPEQRSTHSGAASGGATGFAPLFAPRYAPEFGSAKGATDYQAPSSAAHAYAPQEVAARQGTYSTGASGGSAGFAPTYASAYAPAFGSRGGSANGASAYQAASVPAAPAYSPQYSEPSSGGASGFAPLFAPAYAPEYAHGSGSTEGRPAPLLRDILQSPASGFSAPAPSFASWGRGAEASKGASGFAPLFGAAYAPAFAGQQMMDLDKAETSPNGAGTGNQLTEYLAVTLMGLSIGGVIFAVKRVHQGASTSNGEPLVA